MAHLEFFAEGSKGDLLQEGVRRLSCEGQIEQSNDQKGISWLKNQ
jgi:hypothetical protein